MQQIPLTQGKFAIVDNRDYRYLKNYKWFTNAKGHTSYAIHNFHRKKRNGQQMQNGQLAMHRVILNARPGEQIDHINHNGLDNRRANIRICSRSQNQWNQACGRGTSKYKGVTPNGNRWQAQIGFNKETLYLGLFCTEEDAAAAYNNAAIKYFGKFAKVNKLEE